MMTETIVAILAAIGGAGGLIQLVKAIQAYRDGIKTREEQADERLVKRLEKRVETLELRADHDARYIRRLISAMGTAGIPIPPRVGDPEDQE